MSPTRRISALGLAVALAVAMFAPAVGAHPHAEDDGGTIAQSDDQISDNVEHIHTIPGSQSTREVNFLYYPPDREVLVTVGPYGLRTYDLADPTEPEFLAELGDDVLRLPDDHPTAGSYHQGESFPVDHRRHLAFLPRDSRAFGQPQNQGTTGVYIVDLADPEDPELITFHDVPAGHTTTCINDCQYLWSGGPMPDQDMPDDWLGRPIFVVDVRNPENPYTFPDPVDTERYDGVTHYAHDVQVDNMGIAWVSGFGGVRGYWTEGRRWDPVEERHRVARPWDPVPYAGGAYEKDDEGAFISLSHNAERPVDGHPHRVRSVEAGSPGAGGRGPAGQVGRGIPQPWQFDAERRHVPGADDGADLEATGFEPGELVYVTNEAFSPTCETDGQFYVLSLEGSYDGEGWRSTPEDPFRLEVVGQWQPAGEEGQSPATSCSAHYFQMKDGLVVMGFYGQGVRFLDVTDPTDIQQVGYWNPHPSNAWAAHIYEDMVFVPDTNRGVDIIRLTD